MFEDKLAREREATRSSSRDFALENWSRELESSGPAQTEQSALAWLRQQPRTLFSSSCWWRRETEAADLVAA